MNASLRDAARAARALLAPDHVECDGAVLPARHLRCGGAVFADDRAFLGSAEREAERLASELGLGARSRLLDVGCGAGRLPIGILRRVGEIAEYRGVDVDRRLVRWCERRIARAHPTFRFAHADIRNARYNPRGQDTAEALGAAAGAGPFDLVYMYSVVSHLTSGDVRATLAALRRLLAPGGRVFLTAFVEQGVEDEAVNPPGYGLAWEGPLHGVRYARPFFERLIAESGFTLERTEHGTEANGQSAFTLAPR